MSVPRPARGSHDRSATRPFQEDVARAQRSKNQHPRRRHRHPGTAPPRLPADPRHVASRRPHPRRTSHRSPHRPARLRRQRQALGRPQPRGVRQAHDGPRPGPRHARARLRRVRRGGPRSGGQGRPPDDPRLPAGGHQDSGAGHRPHPLLLPQRRQDLRPWLLALVFPRAAGTAPRAHARPRPGRLDQGPDERPATRRPAVRPQGDGRVRPVLSQPRDDPRLLRGLPRRRRHRPGGRRRVRRPGREGDRPAAGPVGRARLRRRPL